MSICYWKASASLSKNTFCDSVSVSIEVKLVLSLLLMFHQVSGLDSYKTVFIKRMYSKVLYVQCPYLHGVSL